MFHSHWKATSTGTGRNARITNIVTEFDNYKFFPVPLPQIVPKQGRQLIFKGNTVFSTFWNEFKDYLGYESYLDGNVSDPIFCTKTGDKVVGALFKVGTGHLILLPPLIYDEKKFTRHDEKKKQDFWTKEAVQFGERLLQHFIEIDRSLRAGGERTPSPDWIKKPNFELSQETKLLTEIDEATQKMDDLILKKNELIIKLENEIKLKDLLFEKGPALEHAIISALEILGYKAENYDDGFLELDQVILSPEGDRFIGEAEGKDTSAINIDKFRQLTSNIQEDLQREDVSSPAIGILFGNGYRLAEPFQRPEQFTDKCIKTAASSSCILIRTSDLFNVAKYIKESNDKQFAKKCRKTIKNSSGKIVTFPEVPKKADAIKHQISEEKES